MTQNVLVTGAAGFIGMFVARRLLADGYRVIGVDNLNSYYDPQLKIDRLKLLQNVAGFEFRKVDLAQAAEVSKLFEEFRLAQVAHLAAQAGVRYSIDHPHDYVDSNITGFLNVLEGCRKTGVEHLLFASSSSVYGVNGKIPFSVHDPVDHPISLYAATKKSNELMAHSYSHLFGIPVTGLRFFTVYGPWGRPDMAYFLFTRSILNGTPIDVFNNGRMQRDFTYIDDVVEGVVRALKLRPKSAENWSAAAPDPAASFAPYRLYNIGSNRPIELLSMISELEDLLGKKAVRRNLPMQAGDVPVTFADVSELERDTGFRPATPLRDGLKTFVDWYRSYYRS